MSGVTGDFGRLSSLHQRIVHLADGSFMQNLRRATGATAVSLVDREFASQQNPYGQAWKPSNGFGPATLTVTSQSGLRGSFHARPTGDGFLVSTDKKYAAIHNYGGVIKAKAAEWLRFKVPVSSRIATTRGGWHRLKNPTRAQMQSNVQWVQVKSVRIPQRQIIPEGKSSPLWTHAIGETADSLMRKLLGP